MNRSFFLCWTIFCIFLLLQPAVSEELEDLFVDDNQVYIIDGIITKMLAKYEVFVKDPFENGIPGMEFDCDIRIRKQPWAGAPWIESTEYLNGTTNDGGYLKFVLLVQIDDGQPPEPAPGQQFIYPVELAQNGIFVGVVSDPEAHYTGGWPKYEFLYMNLETVGIPTGYTVVYSPDTYTTQSIHAASFLVINSADDQDGNGVADVWELQLAQKFCPNLKLHSGDNGVRPVPVEIMDRNGDGVLGWEDVYVRVYTEAGALVGTFNPANIYLNAEQFYYAQLYPYFSPQTKKEIRINGGAPGLRLMYSHFEWGDVGNTNPSDWYSNWNSKMAQHSGDLRFSKGTTYAHLFFDGTYTIIQYYFYYPFNAASNRHEGDWENINVVLNNQNPDNAQINKVVYYFHHERVIRTNPQMIENSHPRVYIGGYTDYQVEGAGSHGSYPETGSWYTGTMNIYEDVDGLGMEIDFDNYQNVVVLPRIEYVNNHQNNTTPFINSQGINLNWMIFCSFWGQPISSPSAFEIQYNVLKTLFEGWGPLIGPGFIILKKVVNIPENVGNIAPVGPVQQIYWEDGGY